MHYPPNLLILGASGGLAHALLQLLPPHRHEIGALILLDRKPDVVASPFLKHRALDYTFVHHTIDIRNPADGLASICEMHGINLILDLTDLHTLPLLTFAQQAGASYVNTMLNGAGVSVPDLHAHIIARQSEFGSQPHLSCVGMNPGIVNHWVATGIQRHGVPREVVFFEYDSSAPIRGNAPFITWSRQEFLEEALIEPSGRVMAGGQVKQLLPNALAHLADMRPLLEPIITLSSYPRGMVMMHEEVIGIGRRYRVPTSFIYGIHPASLAALSAKALRRERIATGDLLLADNVNVPLTGSDLIGVWLKYTDKDIYTLNEMHNRGLRGTNATYRQVAIGVLAGLRAMWHQQVAPGIQFTHDLSAPIFTETVRAHMVVENRVCTVRKPSGVTLREPRTATM